MKCHKVPGVYAIVNLWNGDRYVGSSVNIPVRWRKHRSMLRRGKHVNRHLQSAWNKWGEASFEFVILERCSRERLVVREQWHLDRQADYNIALYADNPMRGIKGGVSPLKGRIITPEWAAKIGAANRGKVRTVAEKQRLSDYYTQKRHEREQWMLQHPGEKPPPIQIHPTGILSGRRGVPSWNKGVPLTAERRQHLSNYQRQNPTRGMLGKSHTEETRQRLAEKTREGWDRLRAEREQWQIDHPGELSPPIFVFPPQSEETIRKRADANRGRKHSAEWNENISKAQRGVPRPYARGKRPPEVGQKIAAAAALKREAREQWLRDHPGQELPPEMRRKSPKPRAEAS